MKARHRQVVSYPRPGGRGSGREPSSLRLSVIHRGPPGSTLNHGLAPHPPCLIWPLPCPCVLTRKTTPSSVLLYSELGEAPKTPQYGLLFPNFYYCHCINTIEVWGQYFSID